MQTPCLGLCQSKAARFVLRVMSPSHPRGKLAKQPRNGTVKKREKLFLCATNCLGQLLIPRAVIGNTTMAKATECCVISKKKVAFISRNSKNATHTLFSCLACKSSRCFPSFVFPFDLQPTFCSQHLWYQENRPKNWMDWSRNFGIGPHK